MTEGAHHRRFRRDSVQAAARPTTGRSAGEIDGLNARVEQLEGELARLEVEKQCLKSVRPVTGWTLSVNASVATHS